MRIIWGGYSQEMNDNLWQTISEIITETHSGAALTGRNKTAFSGLPATVCTSLFRRLQL